MRFTVVATGPFSLDRAFGFGLAASSLTPLSVVNRPIRPAGLAPAWTVASPAHAVSMQTSRGPHATGVPCSACRPAGSRRAEHSSLSPRRSPFRDLRVWARRWSPSRRRRHASRVWSPVNCIVTAKGRRPARPVRDPTFAIGEWQKITARILGVGTRQTSGRHSPATPEAWVS
jgi:hypothetical protein